jgi:glycosyltransferase involved in cell wall biosynthesis
MKIMISAGSSNTLTDFRADLIIDIIKRGHEVICVFTEQEDKLKDKMDKLGAKYFCIKKATADIQLINNFLLLLRYIMILQVCKPDLCFFYMSKTYLMGGLAAAICRIEHIAVFVRGINSSFYHKGLRNRVVCFILKSLYKILHRKIEKIFFMNQDDYNKMLHWKMVTKKQSVVVHSPGVSRYYFAKKTLPQTDVVCMISRLLWSKGINEYTEAAKIVKHSYPNVQFLLIGGLDEEEDSLTGRELKSIQEQGSVYYCGVVNDVRPYLEVCTIFVMPGYYEGNCRSIIEAEAFGRPVVVTYSPGYKETVINGYNGFLIPVKNASALAERIIYLLEHPRKKEIMAENSYLLCRERHDIRIVNEILLDSMKL